MRFLMRTAAVLLVLLMSACGGGGGGGTGKDGNPYSITLSAPSVAFDVQDQSTDGRMQTINVNFNGDGVLVGTLPGQTSLPDWLYVYTPPTATGGTTTVQLTLEPGVAVGNYSFTLRFVTGKADGSQYVYVDLPVTATVHESFGLIVNGTLAFAALEGGTAANVTGSGTLTVRGENPWHASSSVDWIKLGQPSGTGHGPLPFSIAPDGLHAGSYNGQISLTDDKTGQNTFANVQLNVTAPSPTQNLTSINFNVTPTSTSNDIKVDLVLSDQLNGQNSSESFLWQIVTGGVVGSPASAAITYSPATGNTTGAATHVTVSLDPTRLNGLPSQTVQTSIIVNYKPSSVPGGYTGSFSIPVKLTVRLPKANTATPYIVSANAARRISIIGNDFQNEDLAKISIAGVTAPTFTRLSSQEIAVDLPALAAGQYPVTFVNGLGLTRSSAEISVQGAPSIGAGEIVSAGRKSRLVADSARGMLYAANPGAGQIERYQWDGTNWNALTPTALAAVADITPARNGRELYASTQDGYYKLDLTTLGATATSLLSLPMNLCGSFPAALATTEIGGFMSGVSGNDCGQDGWFSDVLTYDALSKSLLVQGELERTVTWVYPRAVFATSADGRYLAVGESGGVSGFEYGMYDVRNASFDVNFTPALNGTFTSDLLDMDAAADKVLVNNVDIRSHIAALLGHLPANRAARINAAGTKAYIYIHVDGGLGKIQVIDLTATITPSATYPVLAEIPVPYDMGDSPAEPFLTQANFAMTLSSDEQFAFLSGTSRVVAIALP